ncbi:MAG: O-succinylhomoserine sulfhydrylase [Geminicoccaceae bacterium]
MNKRRGPRTELIHGGIERSQFGETAEPIHMTSGFIYERAEQAEDRFRDRDQGFMYSRYGNPTVRTFEERMMALEGAEAACATGSGMAAVHAAIMCQMRSGMRVVAARLLFGSCRYILTDILTRFGVEIVLVDGRDLAAWKEALSVPTDLVFFETPGNPTLELVDIEAVSRMAHDAGAKVVVDNVFATPMLQRPLALGADIVAYSATKHIDGQGRCLGGIVLCSKDFHENQLHPYMKHTGPSLSPFNAWVLLKGLETLDLRVERHVASATRLARHLEGLGGIERVIYPGLESHPQYELATRQMDGGSTLLGFYIEGGKERTFRFMNALELILISNNLGDAKTLLTHPATTTHSKLSETERAELDIGDNYVRLSVGLENVEDLIEDIERAIAA